MGLVSVGWIAHADQGPLLMTTTINEPSPKYIKLLSCLAHTKWELGHWCLLPSSNGSVKADSHDSTEGMHESTTVDGSSQDGDMKRDLDSDDSRWVDSHDSTEGEYEYTETGDDSDAEMATEAFLISNVRTTVDVCWQDGIIQRGLDSTSLIIVDTHTLRDHEFFAEQHVVEKHAETGRFGVIKNVDVKERTTYVRWLKPDSGKEEIVNVYELKGNPDYEFYYGDVVVMQPDQRYSEHHEWVGNITNFKDGDVEVTWADGSKSMVSPQAIYVPGEFDDDHESIATGSDGSNGAVGLGTSEEDMIRVDGLGTSEASWGTSEDMTKVTILIICSDDLCN